MSAQIVRDCDADDLGACGLLHSLYAADGYAQIAHGCDGHDLDVHDGTPDV